MEWLKAEIEFASAFSYRMPDTSSQFAIPCLLPGPSTVKLGLVATAILHSKKVDEGERIFGIVKNAEMGFLIPKEIAVFTPLIRRLKAKGEKIKKEKDVKKGKKPEFERTYGTRGYVLYSEPLILYLRIPQACDEDLQKILKVVKLLRRLGTSDSLLSVLDVTFEVPKESPWLVRPLERFTETLRGGLIQKVKDISPNASFEQINIYRKTDSKAGKEVLIEKFYVVPVKAVKEGGNWTLYSRI